MHSFASIRPRLAEWRGWLPAAALPLFMFIALLALGGDRGYFYRVEGDHDWSTVKNLAVAEHLSLEHNFLLTLSVWRDEDGGLRYDPYSRFPIGGYALLNLAMAPFGNDLAAKLMAARVLTLMMFCGAAAFAFLAVSRATGSRLVAFAATPLAFSGFYALYQADAVSGESVMDAFGAGMVFHGMVVFVQEGRFRQLLVKTCAALLMGWHVYALLLPFIVLGFGGEAVALIRSARASKEKASVSWARSVAIALVRSRYVVLATVSILFGSALLAFNFANEYAADRRWSGDGEQTLSDLPSVGSTLRRLGVTDYGDRIPALEWDNFMRSQLYRVGVASVPYAAARAVGWEFRGWEPQDVALAPAVWGLAATVAALAALAFARRQSRLPMATAILFGFCWAIPMRYNTFSQSHTHEAVHYVWLALAHYERIYQDIAASGEPAARSGFDLYLDGGTLSYLKAPCAESDARGRFFLSVHPENVEDLPADRREIGHESLNFTFAPPAGAVFNSKCMASRRLPDYDIARIETGQWVPGGERVWDEEMVVGR